MLLDADHDTFGTVIPNNGPLTNSGDASTTTYDYIEYKIPANADGSVDTKNKVDGKKVKSVTITIPAGIYDWCITNPSPNDCVWIASDNGNIGGRQDDFFFEGGKHYTFTVTLGNHANDCVDMTVEDDETLDQGYTTTITDVTSTSYVLSGLAAASFYTVYVQSVKNGKPSEWNCTTFTTTSQENIGLADASDNSDIIEANHDKVRNVTLAGRTLYKDSVWNTLCLPFDVSDFTGTPLEGAIVKTLESATINNRTLTFNFTADADNITAIEAGKPYIVKLAVSSDITNPVFSDVTIKNLNPTDVKGGAVDFCGTYNPYGIDDKNSAILFLGDDNKLYHPNIDMTIGACRAYFLAVSNLGDVNSDGVTTVTDVTMLVDHILGKDNDNFNMTNADINGDGDINVTDVTAVVNLILGNNNFINVVVNGADGLTFGGGGNGPARVKIEDRAR